MKWNEGKNEKKEMKPSKVKIRKKTWIRRIIRKYERHFYKILTEICVILFDCRLSTRRCLRCNHSEYNLVILLLARLRSTSDWPLIVNGFKKRNSLWERSRIFKFTKFLNAFWSITDNRLCERSSCINFWRPLKVSLKKKKKQDR